MILVIFFTAELLWATHILLFTVNLAEGVLYSISKMIKEHFFFLPINEHFKNLWFICTPSLHPFLPLQLPTYLFIERMIIEFLLPPPSAFVPFHNSFLPLYIILFFYLLISSLYSKRTISDILYFVTRAGNSYRW